MERMSEKAIRVITFSGKKNNWRQWSKKFLVVAEKREYWAILENDAEQLSIEQDEQKKQNIMAYNDLMLAMTEDVSFGLVDEAQWALPTQKEKQGVHGEGWCSDMRARPTP